MSQYCRVCVHPKRAAIDKDIVQGMPILQISHKYGIANNSMNHHSKNHIARKLTLAVEKLATIEGNELMETITRIIHRAENIFERNYDANKDLLALKALDSQRNTIQLLSNISAQVHAAKIAELELLKEKRGDNKDAELEAYKIAITVFSLEELQVYQRFINKLNNQNADIIIKDGKVMSYNRRTRNK